MKAIKLGFQILTACFEIVLWLGWLLKTLLYFLWDLMVARRTVHRDTVRCPRGHETPTSGDVYECRQCGYVYQGSIWVCANPECGAITPYINCQVCGLSIRNPYRIGRPS